MGELKAFMQPPVTDETKEIIISQRFTDEDGKVVPFKIRVISQEVNEAIRKRSSRPAKKNGMVVGESLDTEKFGKELIVACTVSPNFRDSELCSYYKTVDPLEVPGKMLTAGEYNKLIRAINIFNGFITDDGDDVEAEPAKN